MSRRVAFLFLGETLLIPHLYPIVEALAAEAPDLPIDLWVATSVHEALLGPWTGTLGPAVRVRRAPGYRAFPGYEDGQNPPLPAKLPMLARLVPYLARARVVVCAEQTSLWLPTLLPMPSRFVKTSHGVGSMSARDDRRRRSAWRLLVPSERERRTYLDRGFDPGRVVATGYVKSAFRSPTPHRPRFAEERPILLYTPHWQRHRSSWWRWGPKVIEQLVEQQRYNVILAPHQRLVEKADNLGPALERAAALPHIHCDIDSFAMVDGSYTRAADVYLGDTSSQVIEFLAHPRPCLFLNAQEADWRQDPSYAMWSAGPVLDTIDDLPGAVEAAVSSHGAYRAAQEELARSSLGEVGPAAPINAARQILEALDQRH